jgi:hypothetical protein
MLIAHKVYICTTEATVWQKFADEKIFSYFLYNSCLFLSWYGKKIDTTLLYFKRTVAQLGNVNNSKMFLKFHKIL